MKTVAFYLTELMKKKPLGGISFLFILLVLFVAAFPHLLAPYGMNEQHRGDTLSPPSARYLMGTDNLGRDVLSRVIFGARTSVLIGFSATALSTLICTIIGMLTGYVGGKVDMLVQRFVDSVQCFPGILITMIVMSAVGPGILQMIIVLGIHAGIIHSRIIRSTVIGIKENAYIEAAVSVGCSSARIFIRHILPNILAPIIVIFSIRLPEVILIESTLSFLGFGVPAPTPSWGSMLGGSARTHMFNAPWMAIWPGLSLCVVVYSANMFGDAMRDLLDPRLKGRAGRFSMRAKSKARAQALNI